MFISSSTATISAVSFAANSVETSGTDIYTSDSSLTCIAGCNDPGMLMPSGTCTTPVSAQMNSGTCSSYCSSASSDCSACGTNTYNEGYSDNTVCSDACPSGKYIVSDDPSDHASEDQCNVCSTGQYDPQSNGGCITCEAGKFAATTGQSSCDVW